MSRSRRGSFNPAVKGRHAGVHEDQYRTAKQSRLDGRREVSESIQDLLDEDVELFRHAAGIGPDFEKIDGTMTSWPADRSDERS